MLRIAFAGTPDFAVPTLRALAASTHQLVGVLTQPDRPAGRGRALTASPVKRLALELHLPLSQPAGLRSLTSHAELARWEPDVLVVAAYGLILPEAVLALHRAHGVTVLLGRGASAIHADGGASEAVRLEDGETVPFDRLLVCVGIRPETQLAAAAGLDCQDGILVDHALCTSAPAVFALGDCARFPSQRYGRRLRLESIQNALDGAAVVAAAICGEMPCYDPLPIISSLQFGHQLDFIGLAVDTDESRTLEMHDRAELVTLHSQGGNCIACECLDATPDTLSILRDLITKKAPFKETAMQN